MEVFHITTGAVPDDRRRAYGFSAGLAGLVACGFFLDRFDPQAGVGLAIRRVHGGDIYFAATANTYHLLVTARLVAGAFGGVCGTVILSIVGAMWLPMARRGAGDGNGDVIVFRGIRIVGVPLGLYVAAHSSWHVPFYAIAALSGLIVIVVAIITPPIRGHMIHASDEHPVARTWAVMTHPDHQNPISSWPYC